MRIPFTILDSINKDYFHRQEIVNGKRRFVFGAKRSAARYGSGALASVIAKEIQTNTNRKLEIEETLTIQEKRAAKYNNKKREK